MIRKKKYSGKTVFLAVNMHFTDRYSLLISTSGEFANIYILGFPLMIELMINSTNTLISIIHVTFIVVLHAGVATISCLKLLFYFRDLMVQREILVHR